MPGKANAPEYWARLSPEAWTHRSAGNGSQGERVHDWACLSLSEETPAGRGRRLLVRRTLHDPTEQAYFRAYGPAAPPPEELVRIAGRRWSIEEGFAQAKGAVGLDHYEVRRWMAWHCHMTLCLLAQACLTIVCTHARECQDRVAPKGGLLVG